MAAVTSPPGSITPTQWGQILAKAWLDSEFASNLATLPTETVKGFLGIESGVNVDIFPLPPRPEDLTDEQLEAIKAGDRSYHVELTC